MKYGWIFVLKYVPPWAVNSKAGLLKRLLCDATPFNTV